MRCCGALELAPRVERVSHAVPDIIERQHRDDEHDTGGKRQPGGKKDVLLGVGEHVAPGGGGRLDAEAQERERRLDQNGRAHLKRALDDDGGERVRD